MTPPGVLPMLPVLALVSLASAGSAPALSRCPFLLLPSRALVGNIHAMLFYTDVNICALWVDAISDRHTGAECLPTLGFMGLDIVKS